jgi:hypothetical protein
MKVLLAFMAAMIITASAAKADTWFRGVSSYQISATATEVTSPVTLGCGVSAATQGCSSNIFFRVAFLRGLTGFVGFYTTPYTVGLSGLAVGLSGAIFIPPNTSIVMMAPSGGGIIAVHTGAAGGSATLEVTEMDYRSFR